MDMRSISYFSPTTSMEGLLPGLSILCLVLLFVGALGFIFWQWQQQTNRITQERRFLVRADRLRLTRRERNLVLKMARHSSVHPLSRILTNQSTFESAVNKHRLLSSKADRSFLETLREKIFNNRMDHSTQGASTESMIPGSILTIRNIDRDSPEIRGKVLDNDKMGLIVALTNQPGIALNIHTNDHLAIRGQLHKESPVRFMSHVISIIPGPRKMVVLAHAKYINTYTMPQGNTDRKALEPVAKGAGRLAHGRTH